MDISILAIKNTLARVLHRYHVVLFVVVVLGGLAAVIFTLNGIIVRSGSSSDSTPSLPTTFDQTTINHIEQLKTRNDSPATLDLPKGRTNPFVE
jgi:hypothetical protein